MLLRVARRDDAAHRVADQDDRQPGVSAAGDFGDEMKVGGKHLSVLDQRTLSVRKPVPEVVGRVDGGALRDQPVRDVVVAPRVLAVPVGDQGDEARVLVRPLEEDEVAAGAGEGVLDWVGHRAGWHSFRINTTSAVRWYLLYGYWNGIRTI